jgi:diacylglycerol kinase (ATP)
MPQYTSIAIIYNPNSTGSSEDLARDLDTKLRQAMPGFPVELIATTHAGHAEELAYDRARASTNALIVSASGDGGYHEVVNGLMRAKAEGADPVAGLLPAGNANDHFNNLHHHDIVEAIAGGIEQKIDLLELSGTRDGKPYNRYAHSYIGLGLTPQAGAELNKTKLNWLNEMWIVVKVLFTLRPVRLMVDGHRQAFDSLIFSNVTRMSKVITLAEDASAKDGKFEVTAFHRRNKLRLIASLVKASTLGLAGDTQVTSYKFTTIRRTLVQLDGEITTLDATTEVKIGLARADFRCIV